MIQDKLYQSLDENDSIEREKYENKRKICEREVAFESIKKIGLQWAKFPQILMLIVGQKQLNTVGDPLNNEHFLWIDSLADTDPLKILPFVVSFIAFLSSKNKADVKKSFNVKSLLFLFVFPIAWFFPSYYGLIIGASLLGRNLHFFRKYILKNIAQNQWKNKKNK